jgi:hypothetical protein
VEKQYLMVKQVMENPLNSQKAFEFRLLRYDMGSLEIPFIPELEIGMPSHFKSCHVRGIPRTKWGLHLHAQLCNLIKKF